MVSRMRFEWFEIRSRWVTSSLETFSRFGRLKLRGVSRLLVFIFILHPTTVFLLVKLQCRRSRAFRLFKIRKLQRRNEAFHVLSTNESHYARLNAITRVYSPTLVEIFEAEKWRKRCSSRNVEKKNQTTWRASKYF